MPWIVRKRDVDFFVSDLWKDLRSFSVASDWEFGKDCFSISDAAFEAAVLKELAARLEPEAVPLVHRAEGSILFMERIEGIRLFDLVRHLRALEGEFPQAAEARRAVLLNAKDRLRQVQLALAGMADDGTLTGLAPYPLELKVRRLLEFFINVLRISHIQPGWRAELERFELEWVRSYATIPFRDATAKNVIARIDPVVGFSSPQEDMESWLRGQVTVLLERGTSYWENLVLTDVDFSSVMCKF